MIYRSSICVYRNAIYILFLFFYVPWIFAFNNIKIDSDYAFMELKFKKNDCILTRNYITISSDHLKEKSDKEIIIINASSYCPLVSTFSPKKFLSSSYVTDTADFLKKIPGFTTIRSGGSNTDPVFRGMFGSRIRILMDNGELIGACCARMDPPSAYIYPGTFDILNVIKGPQTVLLGPVSSGGTLQFERYHPHFDTEKIELHSNVLIGSNNKIDRNIDSIIGNQYGYIRLIGNVSQSNDYRDGNRCKVHSAWYKWNSDAIISLNFSPSTSYEISIGQGNGSANYAMKNMDGLCFARESYGMKMEVIDISNILDRFELYVWHNYINHVMGNSTMYNIARLSDKKGCISCENNNIDRCVWGMRSILTSQWENIECHSGIDMQINQHGKIRCDDIWYKDILTRDFGIFSELILNMFSSRKFVGGIRIEHYNMFDVSNNFRYKQYHTIYPAGFIRYESNVHPLLYYIGIGTSKRFPDYWELFNIKFNVLDQPLQPEQTVQVDAGVYFQHLQINGWISSYIGYIKDFILYHYDNISGIQNNINYISNVDAKICGAEAELNYRFYDNWYLKSNVAWVYGLNVDNDSILPRIPPLEGTLTCQWKCGYYNMAILWRIVTSSQFDLIDINFFSNNNQQNKCKNNNVKTPGFGILSINLEWIRSKYYRLSVGVDNLCNRNYREHLNCFNYKRLKHDSITAPVYEPGRVWWIKMELIV